MGDFKRYWKDLRRVYSSFSELSTRESSGVRIIKKISGRDAAWVVDPVFLIDKEEWGNYSSNNIDQDNFLLIYCFYSKGLNKFVEDISFDYSKLDIIMVQPEVGDEIVGGSTVISVDSPSVFIELIRKAKAIITDSFHVVCFSLIFRKPLYVYYNGLIESTDNYAFPERIIDLLDSVAVLSGTSEMLGSELIKADYNKLNERIRFSKDFLRRCLGE